MSVDTECPYCGEDVEINHDDGYGYEEDGLHQQECSECEKTFVYTVAISFDHDASRADCLNDGEHQYERTVTYPPWMARMRCKDCGDEQPLPPNTALPGEEGYDA